MKRDSEWVQPGSATEPSRPVSTPIYQTATFRVGEDNEYDYTRSGNPTRTVLEEQLARVEGGRHALSFSSGMAAIATACALASAGEEIVACVDLYGGTYRFLSDVASRNGIRLRYVDTSDPRTHESIFESRPRLVLVETPSNPFQRVTDLDRLGRLASESGAIFAVDNSLMSPYLQRPLDNGAHLVIHSATKFLCGHSDVTAGVLVTNDERLSRQLSFHRNATGSALAPFEAWLLARGMKTLPLRLERQQQTSRRVSCYLRSHARVTRVHYVGLADHPGRETHERQAEGYGSVISFETGSLARSEAIVAALVMFLPTVSFGGVQSTVSLPARMSHASIPAAVRNGRAFPEDLVRLSIGIEHEDDLLSDLEQALSGG